MIKKKLLERFIAKYNLAGAAERVTWVADKTSLSTKFLSDDKHVIGEVSLNQHVLDDGSYYVMETNQLQGLVGVLGDDIAVKVQNTNGRNTGLTFSDGDAKTTFVLASDDSNVPKVPKSKGQPSYELQLPFDKNFMDRFIRAKGALPQVDTFTVISDGKTVDLVLGYSSINTNRITLKTTATQQVKIDAIDFHARCLRDIFAANKEATDGTLFVSSEGLAKITFNQDDFTTTYYLPQIEMES